LGSACSTSKITASISSGRAAIMASGSGQQIASRSKAAQDTRSGVRPLMMAWISCQMGVSRRLCPAATRLSPRTSRRRVRTRTMDGSWPCALAVSIGAIPLFSK
jgi:hypothetical protein